MQKNNINYLYLQYKAGKSLSITNPMPFVVALKNVFMKFICFALLLSGTSLCLHAQSDSIKVKPSVTQLPEANIESQRIVHFPGYDGIYPTTLQRQHAANAFDLLARMQIEGLHINQLEKNITCTRNQGPVVLLVDGVPRQLQDFQTIAPQQVTYVLVSTSPDMRYGPDAAIVVDLRTKRDGKGWGAGLNAMNAASTNYNDDGVWLKAFNKASEWDFRYNFKLNSVTKAFTEKNESFHFADGSSYQLGKDGAFKGGNFRNDDWQLGYNYIRPNRRTFDVRCGVVWDRFPEHRLQEQVNGDANYLMDTWNKSDEKRTSLKLYYAEQFSQRDKLTLYVATAWLKNNYHRGVSNGAFSDLYDVDGDKKSLRAETDFMHAFSPTQRFTVGYQQTAAYTCNKYVGTNSSKVGVHDDSQYAYVQHLAQVTQLAVVVGAGMQRTHFSQGAEAYSFWTFCPKVVFQYAPSPKWQWVYTYSRTPVVPSLADLSNYARREDDFQGTYGNIRLKPYAADRNFLTANFLNRGTNVRMSLAYDHSSKMMDYAAISEHDGLLWSTKENNTTLHHFEALVYMGQDFLNHRLQVYVEPKYTFERSKGLRKHTNAFVSAQVGANAYVGKFAFALYYRTATESLLGETLIHHYSTSDFNVGYTHRALSLKAGIRNAFAPKGKDLRWRRHNDNLCLQRIQGNKGFGNMVYVGLSWNLFKGRQHQLQQVKQTDAALDSGIWQ